MARLFCQLLIDVVVVQSFTSHWDAPPRAHPGHQKFREANGAVLSRGIVEASVCDVICVFVQMYVIVHRCVEICVYIYISTNSDLTSSRKSNSSFGLVWGIFQICFPVQVSKRLGHPKVARNKVFGSSSRSASRSRVAASFVLALGKENDFLMVDGCRNGCKDGICMDGSGWSRGLGGSSSLFLKLLMNHFHEPLLQFFLGFSICIFSIVVQLSQSPSRKSRKTYSL